MMSGTCKKETGEQHVCVIKTILNMTEKQKYGQGITYCIVSIALDGEARQGNALVLLIMTSLLSLNSPIHEHLCQLPMMNLLVGPNDITADKDFKHVFKRQQNLMMCNKGLLIQGFCITPAIL